MKPRLASNSLSFCLSPYSGRVTDISYLTQLLYCLKILYVFYKYISAPCTCSYYGRQKRASDPLALEFLMVVSCLMWMLGISLELCGESTYFQHQGAIFPPLFIAVFNGKVKYCLITACFIFCPSSFSQFETILEQPSGCSVWRLFLCIYSLWKQSISTEPQQYKQRISKQKQQG